MKTTIFAIALLASGAAFAQTYSATVPAPEPVMTTSVVTPMEQTVAPSNAAPEHDARGIAVISDAATAPAGFNQPVGVFAGTGGPLIENPSLPTQPADPVYPACSQTVTDNCVQTYERGRKPQ